VGNYLFMHGQQQTDQAATQADAAYASLHEAILAGRLRPGAKIFISDAAANIGVSPGAVREALSRLAAEKLAVATAQKGFSVAEVSAEELKDLTRTRIAIEQLCVKGAIKHGDLEWEASAVAAFHRLRRLPHLAFADPARREPFLNPAWASAHGVFHTALAAGCASPWLMTLRAMLFAQADRYHRLSVTLDREARDVDAEHEALLEACLARDGGLAQRLIESHLTKTMDIILRSSPLKANWG
jgi:DNA-binding GntR family transcriptional regulator